MSLKKRLLRNSHLYVIIDKGVVSERSLICLVKKIIQAGAEIIQLRDKSSDKKTLLKNAFLLKGLLSKTGSLFIINDHIDVAMLVGADGLHIGQYDLPLAAARKLLGKGKIIGLSCHNIKEACLGQAQGADYLGIGPIFPTQTKPDAIPVGLDLIKKCRDKIKIPFFAIGGINQQNLRRVLCSGGRRVAICRAICQAKDPALVIKKICRQFT